MSRKINLLILLLVTTKLCIHFFTASNYELHRDALLYISLGENPAWGYASVPPSIGVFAGLARFLMGDSLFAIRFFPALIGGFSMLLVCKIVQELGGKVFSVLLAGLAFLLSIAFLRSNSLFQPVSFNQIYWLLSFYLMVRMIRKENPRLWLWIGLVWGVALMNKYSIAFFGVSALLALLLTPQRNYLFRWEFITGMLIAFVIFLPNLIWQYQHNWPVINHMKELQETQLVHTSLPGFLQAQVLMNLHALFLWLLALPALFLIPSLRPYRFVSITWILCISLLIILRGKGYYSLGLYPVLFAFGALALEMWTTARFQFLRPLSIGLVVALSIPFIPLGLPLLKHQKMAAYSERISRVIGNGILTWEDGKVHKIPQDYADMTGWKELAEITEKAWHDLGAQEKDSAMIFAGSYGSAGAIGYYCSENMPDPVSFDDSFVLWAPDSATVRTLIYVDHDVDDLEKYFNNIETFARVDDPWFRERGMTVFICRDPVPEFRELYSEVAAEAKKIYRRDE